jgi:hypothetical protein
MAQQVSFAGSDRNPVQKMKTLPLKIQGLLDAGQALWFRHCNLQSRVHRIGARTEPKPVRGSRRGLQGMLLITRGSYAVVVALMPCYCQRRREGIFAEPGTRVRINQEKRRWGPGSGSLCLRRYSLARNSAKFIVVVALPISDA